MSTIDTFIGTMFAYKVLRYLVTPFTDFAAYKVGLIDKEGKQLKNPETPEEKQAWSVGDRVIIRLKRSLQKSGYMGSALGLASAYWLVKECYQTKTLPSEPALREDLIRLVRRGKIFIPLEEMMLVEGFLAFEDIGVVPTNNTGGIAGETYPVVNKKAARKYREFNVSQETFSKFSKGKKKFDRWAQYLNLEDETDMEVYHFARNHHNAIIVLKNGDQSKAIRFNRKGGGSWKYIPRKRLREEFDIDDYDNVECENLDQLSKK